MPLPRLSPDIWFRICDFLDPASLSSLSQVNKTLKTVTTDKSHFLRFLGAAYDQSLPPAILYRRLTALKYPATHCFSLQLSPSARFLGIVGDSLLLFDKVEECITILPSGIIVNTGRLGHGEQVNCCGDLLNFVQAKLQRFKLRNRQHFVPYPRRAGTVLLPDGRVAMLNSAAPNPLLLLDVTNGEVTVCHIQRETTDRRLKIRMPRYLALAGDNAEWLIYYSDEHTIALFDWRNGIMASSLDVEPLTVDPYRKFLFAECPAVNGMTVVGLLSEEEVDAHEKRVLAKGFDGAEMNLFVDEEASVHSVLRSVDKKTHVLIYVSAAGREFNAYRQEEGRTKKWKGILNLQTCPELRENGRVIVARNSTPVQRWASFEEEPHVRVELKDDCTIALIKPKASHMAEVRLMPVRHRRIPQGSSALHGRLNCFVSRKPIINLTQFVDDGQNCREFILKRLSFSEDWCVIADHFIVVMDKKGKMVVYHFDRFCHGAGGMYACPGFYSLPEEFNTKVSRVHSH